MAEPIRRAVVGAATTEEEGFELVLRHKPSLLICTSDLETGYGMNLLRRVKAELPACQLLIVLVRETQAVVQEAMQAYADAVIFKQASAPARVISFKPSRPSLKVACISPRRFASSVRPKLRTRSCLR